jgi:hypothetical protein
MKAKVGDYLLTEEKQLFRIIDIFTDTTGTYYDIKSIKDRGEVIQLIKAIPRNRFRHLGKVISEEKITKIMKILYG